MEKTPTSLLNAELLATCGALGWSESGKYYKNPDCLQSLKDLIRYLRNDDESHEVRRQLGAIGVVEADLLPLIKNYGQDKDVFDVTLRLLVNLTNPAIVLFKEELPEEKITRSYYQECMVQLQKIKRAFADSRFWTVVSDKLKTFLEQDWEKKEEDDDLVMERILILLRNVLHVPSNPEEEMRTDDDVSIHDQVIWAIHTSGMTDLILYIAANEEAESFIFHVIEIIFHMLREQEPEHLASAGQTRAQSEKDKDLQILSDVRAREKAQKLIASPQSRFPRFNGSFCVRNVKSVSENDLIVHRPLKDVKGLHFDQNKKVRRVPKNRRPLDDPHLTRRSTLNIRLVLRDFCTDFLENAYNAFMAGVKEHLTKKRAQDHDETYYLWALRFMMEFHRLSRMDISRISETVSKSSYHYIHTQIETYCEMMITDKRALKRWSKRTYLALRAYKELILTLSSMMSSKDKKIRDSGRVISGTIFYVMEYRDLLLHLLNIYDPQKYPKSYLKDLVEANHVFLKTLEQFCGQHRHVIVQKKKKQVNKKKSKQNVKKGTEEQSPDFGEDHWEELADSLSHTLQGKEDELPTDVTPFDAASERTFEEQKTDALVKIQDALREKQLGHAVVLLRMSRDLWPEGEVFGALNSKPEVDFLLLREIFFTELPRAATVRSDDQPAHAEEVQGQRDDEEDDEEENHEELAEMKISEQEFNFTEFITRFARPKVVQAYCLLLSRYRENSAQTNHCLLKMMHRLAWDHKMHGMFFQASLFRSFQAILADPAKNTSPLLKEMSRFAVFIVRKFFETAEKNKKVFMELLFWKNPKEVLEIQEGYGTTADKSKGAKAWTEAEDAELTSLFERFGGCSENGKDAIDLIQDNFSNASRTRRQILRHLKSLGLVQDLKQYARKTPTVKTALVWSEEDVEQLTELYEKFKASTDIMSRLFEGLQTRKSKRSIGKKLLELGLVTDRKQLYKKGSKRKSKEQDLNMDDDEVDDRISSDDDDSGRESDSDGQESDEEEQQDDVPLGSLRSTPAASQVKVKRKTRPSIGAGRITSPVLNLSTISAAFRAVEAHGLVPAVDWLKISLDSAAEDREEDDDWEPVPLVTFTEDQSTAMTKTPFVKLIRALGIVPPANEQESFWRIPATLSPEQLRERSDILEKARTGQLATPDQDTNSLADMTSHETPSTPSGDVGNAEDEERNSDAGHLSDSNGRTVNINDGDEEQGQEDEWPTVKKRRRTAQFNLDDDDDDQDQDDEKENINIPPSPEGHSEDQDDGLSVQKKKKKRRRTANFVLDDEEDEGHEKPEDATSAHALDGPEDVSSPREMQPDIDSDQDTDDPRIAPRRKRPKMIFSDDEDE